MKFIEENFLACLIGLFICFCLGSCMNSCIKYNTWKQFKKDNNCIVIESMEGELLTGVLSNGGVIFTSTPDKECWRCDNGKKYWKDK